MPAQIAAQMLQHGTSGILARFTAGVRISCKNRGREREQTKNAVQRNRNAT
jgi:hypothetical protein